MFHGLSAFPLTPVKNEEIDELSFERLILRLTEAGVESLGVLGSTGNYMYLSQAERVRVVKLAVSLSGDIPVMAGIGAMRARDVLANAELAQGAGADALLLAPVSYQPLTEDEVFALFKAVSQHVSVPVCVYDNPRTTQFQFTPTLYQKIAELPHITSIKIPGVDGDLHHVKRHVGSLQKKLPENFPLGVSGDALAANGLLAGCSIWYSVIGGLFPQAALGIARAALSGNVEEAQRLSQRLQPLWDLFAVNGGSLRVIAAAAEILDLVETPCLPQPLLSLDGPGRTALVKLIEELGLQ